MVGRARFRHVNDLGEIMQAVAIALASGYLRASYVALMLTRQADDGVARRMSGHLGPGRGIGIAPIRDGRPESVEGLRYRHINGAEAVRSGATGARTQHQGQSARGGEDAAVRGARQPLAAPPFTILIRV